jgi:opacity protein-like surface antigen
MKIKKKVLLVSLVLLTITTVATVNASSVNGYIGGKVNYGNFKPKKGSMYHPVGVGLGGGVKYDIIDEVFIGGEGYVNHALNQPKKKGVKLKYGLTYEVNALAGINVTKDFNIYALVGGIGSKPTIAGEKFKNNISLQYGGGIGFNVTDGVGLKLQYTLSNPNYKYKVANNNKLKAKNNTINLALNYNF